MEYKDFNSDSTVEQNWNCEDVARQLVDIQKAMSSSLLTLVKSMEEDVGVGITPERIPVIRDKYASLSRRVQHLSTVSEPPTMRNLSRASSNAALSWASDYFMNVNSVIGNNEQDTTVDSNDFDEHQSRNILQNSVNYMQSHTDDVKKEQLTERGLGSWFRKKFNTLADKRCLQNNFRNNIFTEQIDTNISDELQINNDGSVKNLCVFDSNQMPLTDLYGHILKDIFGQALVLFNNRGIPLDRFGSPVFDSRGVPSNAQSFSPTENYRLTKFSPIALYDSKGYPLTGNDGHALLDPSGETLVKFSRQSKEGFVLCDKDGGGVWDNNGVPLCPVRGCWIDQDGLPYRFFNSNGQPVTDSKGRELFDIHEQSLLTKDSFGRPCSVQDTLGVAISAYAFDGTIQPPNESDTNCCFKGNIIRLYNSKGHPLNDQDGRVLYDSFGNPLVKVDFHKNPLNDEEGASIFDGRKIPLFCNPTESILNMDEKPMIFYDKNKKPLTDRRGIPLVYASGMLLLKFDEIGRPCSDQKGKPLCDFNGNELNDKFFDATNCPNSFTSQLQIIYSGKPGFIVYDRNGRPLTDLDGNALINSDGTSLEFNVIRQRKKVLRQEYDQYGRPLYNKFNKPIYNHEKPLLNMFGKKLIDIDILKTDLEEGEEAQCTRLGEFNKFGMPIKDKYLRDLYNENGEQLCDKSGWPESKVVYNCEGILLSVKDVNQIIQISKERINLLYGLSMEKDGLVIGIPQEFSIVTGDSIIAKPYNDDDRLPLEDEQFDYVTAVIRTSQLSALKTIHEILAIQLSKN